MKTTRGVSVWVSIFIAASVLLAQPALTKESVPPPRAKITLIYISAWNCPPCIYWSRQYKPLFQTESAKKHIIFREVEAYRYQSIGEDGLWPEDLRWVRDELGIIRGTPRWIILNDGKIELSGRGSEWRNIIWPRLREIVAAARESS